MDLGEIFAYAFVQRAMLAGALIAAVSALLGCRIISRASPISPVGDTRCGGMGNTAVRAGGAAALAPVRADWVQWLD